MMGTKVLPHIWGLFNFTHLQWGKPQMWGDTLVPYNAIYKHSDQRLGTMAVTQCVNRTSVKSDKIVIHLSTETKKQTSWKLIRPVCTGLKIINSFVLLSNKVLLLIPYYRYTVVLEDVCPFNQWQLEALYMDWLVEIILLAALFFCPILAP